MSLSIVSIKIKLNVNLNLKGISNLGGRLSKLIEYNTCIKKLYVFNIVQINRENYGVNQNA